MGINGLTVFNVIAGLCSILGVGMPIWQMLTSTRAIKYRAVRLGDRRYSVAIWNASRAVINKSDILFLGVLCGNMDKISIDYTNDNIDANLGEGFKTIVDCEQNFFVPINVDFITSGSGVIITIEFNKSDNNKAGIIGRINNEVKSSVGYFRTPTKTIWGKAAYAIATIIEVIFCMIFAVFAIFCFAMHFIQESVSIIPILMFAAYAILCAYYTVSLILPGKMPIELYRRQKSGMGFRAYRKNTLSNHNDIIRYSDLDGFYRPERSREA